MKKDKVQHLRNVPKLRFSSFKETYKQYTFEDIAIFLKGKGISKIDIDEEGKLECIRYGELYTKYGEKINIIYSKTNVTDVVLSKRFDVITPSSGETAIDLATASCVQKDGIALGGDINIIRSKENGLYLSYYLNSNKKLDFAKLGQGNSVVHIYNSHLKKLMIKLPSFEEQSKVARYISSIDDKIELMEVKLKNLKLFKKGLVDYLFDKISKPENLFSIKDHCVIESSSIDKKSNYLENPVNLVNYMDVYNNEYINLNNIKNVVVTAKDLQIEKCAIKKGDLLITPTSETPDDIGHTALVTDSFRNYVFSYHLMRIKFNNIDVINEYKPLIFANSFMKTEFFKRATGSTRFTLSMKDFNEISFYLPNIVIQKHHSKLYSKISSKIDQCDMKIKTLKQFKKGLLQQMFVQG